jgi:drug/metabolite transporter (DMT)-like permease
VAEPRWLMATAVLAATILHIGMPHRGPGARLVGLPGAATIWVANVISFSLWYRQIDRGGPARLTMMIRPTLSLVIAILVLARAINILPGEQGSQLGSPGCCRIRTVARSSSREPTLISA